MLLLSFDTTSSILSTSLLEDEKVIAKNSIFENGKQSELLIPEIEKILKENKIWYQDLDLIATSSGPGSFTGTRIGLTAARILKLSTNLPLILVNSCEAAAFKYRDKSGKIFVTLDASMNEFFCAEFLTLKQVSEPQLAKPNELSQIAPQEKFLLCGSGKKIAAEILKKENFQFKMSDEEDVIEADLVGLLAYKKFRAGEISENLNPIYLRMPRVEQRKK